MHQRPSRCCMCAMVSAATSDRLKPQPSSTAMMARSRTPFVVVMSGAFRSACACFSDSQFPKRTPLEATPLTRVIPLASSGASSPLSPASTASFRTAVIRTLMETEPRPRASRATREAATVAFVKPGQGLLPVPRDEFVQPEIVDPFGDRGGHGIEDQGLQPVPMCRPVRQYQIVHVQSFVASESARYWALSVVTWTLALGRNDIKIKVEFVATFQRVVPALEPIPVRTSNAAWRQIWARRDHRPRSVSWNRIADRLVKFA